MLGVAVLAAMLLVLGSCQGKSDSANSRDNKTKKIVVTYSILGSVLSDLLGEELNKQASVLTLIPNGLDPHEWEPSAQDIAQVYGADLIVVNGLGLEAGLEKTLAQAKEKGIPIFTATDHIAIRKVSEDDPVEDEHGDEEDEHGDEELGHGGNDPHFWLDPQAVALVANAFAIEIKSRFSIDLQKYASQFSKRVADLDGSITAKVAQIPANKRLLITGHESLGYFADRYGFGLLGAIVPSFSTQAGVSAGDVSALAKLSKDKKVNVVFTELGTPPKVAEALARDAGVKAVAIDTHLLGSDGSWFTMIERLTDTIVDALK